MPDKKEQQQQQTKVVAPHQPPPPAPGWDSPNPSPRHQQQRRAVKLRNVGGTESAEAYDTLHQKAFLPVNCTSHMCVGSIIQPPPPPGSAMPPHRPAGVSRSSEEVLRHAKDFIDQYYASIKRLNSAAHRKRWGEVVSEVESSGVANGCGTYHLTGTELVYGAKLAWRNAQRCIGRIQWSKLQVFDARFVTTTSGMFEAICNHIKYATNKGNIRSAITVFTQRTDGKHDFRVWNSQLVGYACYKLDDGTCVGDPASVDFTQVCLKLGWKGTGGQWDILPLVLSASGHDPEYFDIPKDLVLQVSLKHPNFPWFESLGLRWYALPAVANMLFDVGGIEFPAAPFNGWYMSTEIGSRDLGDVNRYNMLEKVAIKMGLDTNSPATLWKDRATIELNYAVLHSFQSQNVTIVDHHTAAESFIKHLENEQRLRGGCPADWVWIVPPMSGSATPVFHQEMLAYCLKPSYEYQEAAWKTHVWKKDSNKEKNSLDRRRSTRKFRFKEIARAVKFTSKLFGKALSRRIKATVLFATETGKSEGYAKTVCDIFSHAFNTQVCCMNEYDIINLEHEALVLVVTSTFGNGDPPENGEEFARNLYSMKMAGSASTADDDVGKQSKSFIKMNSQSDIMRNSQQGSTSSRQSSVNEFGPLGNVRFAVFALGSSAYPNFCAFGKYVDHLLCELGGERLLQLHSGDELGGQEQAFKGWARGAFQTACEVFCVGDDVSLSDVAEALRSESTLSALSKSRTVESKEGEDQHGVDRGLAKVLNKPITDVKLLSREYLQAPECDQKTLLIRLDIGDRLDQLPFAPGDHIGVCPENSAEIVNGILALVDKKDSIDTRLEVQTLKERQTANGTIKTWIAHERLPPCTLRVALTHYLDVTSPLPPQTLQLFAALATDDKDQQRLQTLATNSPEYETWKYSRHPNVLEVLHEFPSVVVDATVLLTLLPPLQPRFYSISSSPKMHPDEIHLTVGVLTYNVQDGSGRVHHGVCSGYLETAAVGSSVHCFIRTAPNFHLPDDPRLPVIMVGPGTGIAPFRSFWQELLANGCTSGSTTLYFGCRTPDTHLYEGETAQLKRDGVLADTHVAYSRLPGQPKVYVQQLLRETSLEVYQRVYVDGGHFYVCGDVKMAEDVNRTLRSILASWAGLGAEQAEAYMLSMRDENRYHEDIFGITFRMGEVQSQRLEESWSKSQLDV